MRGIGIFVALLAMTIADAARADEIEGTIYAARRRPLAAESSPGNPDVKRSVFGGGVEWLDAPAEEKDGWVLRVGAAVEYQSDCAWDAASCGATRTIDQGTYTSTLPDDHVEAGGHARAGYVWRFLEAEAGLLVYSATYAGRAGVEPAPQTSFVPDVVARVGSRRTFVAVGYGSFAAPTMLSPLLYLQAELAFAEQWSTALTAGDCELDDYRHERFDLTLRYRVTKNLLLGEGLALTYARRLDGGAALGGDARFSVAWTF
ncbi:MAG TPA: hypothetical protein VIF62_02055 [Labilithrix sp.]